MSALAPTRQIIFWVLFLVLGCLPVQAQEQPPAPKKLEAPASSPEALPKILEDASAALREKISALQAQLTQTRDMVHTVKADLGNLQVAVASVKAALAVNGLPLSQVPEVLVALAQRQNQVQTRSKEVSQEIDNLKKVRDAEITAQNTLRTQISIIRFQVKALSPDLQRAYQQYVQLADKEISLFDQVLDNLNQQGQVLGQETELLATVLPQLGTLEQAWRAELLKRPAQPVPFKEQIKRVWEGVAALPGRLWQGLSRFITSGLLVQLLQAHLTHLLGLLGFVLLLNWGKRRLNRLVAQRFQAWKERSQELGLFPLFMLGFILFNNLVLLGLILWVGLLLWIFGMLDSQLAQLAFYGLLVLWALRLALQWVQSIFAGKDARGLLLLGRRTARFYRRSLKLLLVYLFIGIFTLKSAAFLGFPRSSRFFMWHIFLIIFLGWVLYILRRPYLAKLLPQLPEPDWLHHPVLARLIRALVTSFLAVIILVELLGFQNLSNYLAWGVSWTLLALVVFWLLWLLAETGLRHLLHPEKGWAKQRYPERHELVQRAYVFARVALAVVLGSAVVLWSLRVWGVKPEQAAFLVEWITWGPRLGPIRLTLLHLGGSILAIYLGIWLSRFVRTLMGVRIFPRTGLDSGVQYTITTSVHYVVLILAVLIALNILGFPLTNLALVAGALGVGIGFGLQNIVNNFISGLILLFERPIKVGDMLVIDGKWGAVREIRVRSTIFETYDRNVLIIPNSELIAQKVLNWTYYGWGVNRLTLKVGVGYNSDVRQVTQLLVDICQANPRVLADPAPKAYLTDYGESSLEFTVWAHIKTPTDRNQVTHELYTAILQALQFKGIEMPNPQQDLHIKDWPEVLVKPPTATKKEED